MTVDPSNIPKSLTRDQIEYWILFTIAVAGKGAAQTAKKMQQLMLIDDAPSPFAKIKAIAAYGTLDFCLRLIRFGQYKRIEKAFGAVVELDIDALAQAEPREALHTLMAIPGIGPKSARMILMYSFEHHKDLWVPLDTHVLKWLRAKGYTAPVSTPQTSSTYEKLEGWFRIEAIKRGLSMAELDTRVWQSYAENGGDLSWDTF